ncbi:unnamed protein product [Peronospora belbahrii]|uniref:Uncharacterized protein n=1 Tax=Peronospora belbahrii TaxID=622444 RepID=A0AAU9L2M5_9STRA|nr:unnamed protein product [Peronospora belbahrii]
MPKLFSPNKCTGALTIASTTKCPEASSKPGKAVHLVQYNKTLATIWTSRDVPHLHLSIRHGAAASPPSTQAKISMRSTRTSEFASCQGGLCRLYQEFVKMLDAKVIQIQEMFVLKTPKR